MLRMGVQLSALLIIPRCWLHPTAALKSTEMRSRASLSSWTAWKLEEGDRETFNEYFINQIQTCP